MSHPTTTTTPAATGHVLLPKGASAIRFLAEEDRPREKMMQRSKQALTDAELLAILIGSGTVGESAVALAQRMLQSVGHNLHDLGKLTLKDLQRFKGIGEAKAITIAAALELGRRRRDVDKPERAVIGGSLDAYRLLKDQLNDLHHEEFWIILLNRANAVLGVQQVSTGGSAGTVVDAKHVFKIALDARASGLVAVHNHPSGSLQPSQADIDLTKRLSKAGQLLDLSLLDHLIISERGYYSFMDAGMM